MPQISVVSPEIDSLRGPVSDSAQSFLMQAFENLEARLAWLDRGCNILRVNRTFAQAIGAEPQALTGRGYFEVCPGEPEPELFRQALATGEPQASYGIQCPYARCADRICYWDRRLQPVNGESGTVEYLLVCHVDVSERVHAERERRSAQLAMVNTEKRFHAVIDKSSDLLILCGTNATILYVNPQVLRATGHAENELVGHCYYDFIHPDEQQDAREHSLAIVDHPEYVSTIERRFRCKDGSWLALEIIARNALGDSSVQGVIINGRDVTERNRQRQELRFKNAILAAQQDTSPDGILVVGQDGRIISCNRAFMQISGLPETTAGPGSHAAALRHVVHQVSGRKAFLSRVRAMVQGREGKVLDEITLNDGRILERYSAPMLGEDGTYYGRVWHVRDISERKRTDAMLRKSLEDAVRALAVTVESRDPYTAGHQRRVSELSVLIGRELGLDEDRLHGLRLAGAIHDLGKIGIPAEILNKPGPPSAIERDLVRTHAQRGYDILKDIAFPWPIARVVREHHERMDGSGYPQGLRGEDILLESRIVTVADVLEAMSSYRPYRSALGLDVALAELRDHRGVYYDADAVDACIAVLERIVGSDAGAWERFALNRDAAGETLS
jgi:PAS domain S-box-containing protein